MKKKIAILGSTGSIGKSTLDVLKKNKTFNVFLLSTNKNFKEINSQIKVFNPKIVIIKNYRVFKKIKKKFKKFNVLIYNNYSFLKKFKKRFDVTISAISGLAGLEPTLNFIRISKEILLANKESIVCGWNLINKEANIYKTKITPIDSEHYSIAKLIKNYKNDEIENIFITASGGPFLKYKFNSFNKIKPHMAIKHPKWKMGKKISIDSATLVNKVLEVSEAYRIFNFPFKKYKIVIHPESLVHAIIQLTNGVKIFLYHNPDMKILIADALNIKNLSISSKQKNQQIKNLSFVPVDYKRFPVIKLLPKINLKFSSLIVFNAANETFVDHFLRNKIEFTDISRYLKLVIKLKKYIKLSKMKSNTLNQILKIDQIARNISETIIKKDV